MGFIKDFMYEKYDLLQLLWFQIDSYQSLESLNIFHSSKSMTSVPNLPIFSKEKPITKIRKRRSKGKTFAVKQVLPNEIKTFIDPSFIDVSYFINEATILSACSHPRVVSYFGSSLSKDRVFSIEMEMLQGGTLERGISGDYQKLYKWIFQICEGLHHIHQRGIVHRDIKLSNLMLDSNGNVKIIDFGAAIFKWLIPQQGKKIVGTPCYIAPEMILQRQESDYLREYDQKIDVYSLGVCVYQLIYNRIPFEGADKNEYWRNTINQEITYEGSCPQQLLRVLKGMLSKSPKNRLSVDQILRNAQIFKRFQ